MKRLTLTVWALSLFFAAFDCCGRKEAPAKRGEIRLDDSDSARLAPSESRLVDEFIEATELLYGKARGKSRSRKRARLLVARLRGDTRIRERRRFEIVALSEHMDFEDRSQRKPQGKGESATWAELEMALIEEFPAQPYGYEALMSAGEHASDRSAADGIAQSVLAYEHAPSWVKDRAQQLLSRNDLVGLSLSSLLQSVWPEGARVASSGETVVYSWSISDLERAAYVGEWLERLPKKTAILGICLDANAALAKEAVEALGLPGLQFYDEGGESPCARRLHASMPSLLYVTDAEGLLQDARLRHSLASKSNNPNQPRK